jgi:hypothetical protein
MLCVLFFSFLFLLSLDQAVSWCRVSARPTLNFPLSTYLPRFLPSVPGRFAAELKAYTKEKKQNEEKLEKLQASDADAHDIKKQVFLL